MNHYENEYGINFNSIDELDSKIATKQVNKLELCIKNIFLISKYLKIRKLSRRLTMQAPKTLVLYLM